MDAAWWRPSRPRKLVELEQGLYDPSTARPAPRIRYAFRTLGIFVFRCGPSPRPIGRHVQSALGPARLLRQRGASMCNDDAPSARMSRPARRTTPSGKRVGNAPGEVSRRLVAPREGPNPRNRGTAPLGQLVDSLEEALRTPNGMWASRVGGVGMCSGGQRPEVRYAIGFRTRAQGSLSGLQRAGPAQRSLQMALGPPCNWQRRAFHAARHATPPGRRGRLSLTQLA